MIKSDARSEQKNYSNDGAKDCSSRLGNQNFTIIWSRLSGLAYQFAESGVKRVAQACQIFGSESNPKTFAVDEVCQVYLKKKQQQRVFVFMKAFVSNG